MNNPANDKLNLIWALAADEYVQELIREARTPKADAKIDAYTENRILRMIRREHGRTKRRKLWKALRIALVACLVFATLILAACMVIPTIREAIWKVVLEWGDESVKVDFVPADDPDYTTADPSGTTTAPIGEPNLPVGSLPTSIEEVNIPSYMPAGYTTESSIDEDVFTLDYYNENGENVIAFQQTVISLYNKGDAEEGNSTEIVINGLNAVLFTYEDEPNVYSLFWQDHQYRYHIYAYLESYDELIRLASSVQVK